MSSLRQPAWAVPPSGITLAVLVCLALASQFLFQGSVQGEWPLRVIGAVWFDGFWQALLAASTILAVLAVAGRVPVRHGAAKAGWFGVALLAGAYLGEWAILWLQWRSWPTAGVAAVLPLAMRWLPIGAAGAAILAARGRTLELTGRLHRTEVSRLELEREQSALQLQLLQSQVEPHFLFNTLATIRRLHRTDPARGRETLAGFIHYLKATLPALRESETTLGRELDLVVAYLDVLRVRMGERLRFDVDAGPSLRDLRVPPFSVATLVENAVKHGLAGLPDGGSISVSAWVEGDDLKVRVADTGKGFSATSGSGTGLANLRSRLRSLYGSDGSLSLAANAPRGVAAILRVPARRHATGVVSDAA